MIIWTVTGGASGSADTLHRAAAEACEAAAAWLDEHAPSPDVGDHLPAATVCVGDGDTRIRPIYDPARCYDPDATRQIGHHLLDQLATDIAEWPGPGHDGTPGG